MVAENKRIRALKESTDSGHHWIFRKTHKSDLPAKKSSEQGQWLLFSNSSRNRASFVAGPTLYFGSTLTYLLVGLIIQLQKYEQQKYEPRT